MSSGTPLGGAMRGVNSLGPNDSPGERLPQREYFYFVDVHGRLHLEADAEDKRSPRQKVYNIATCFKVGHPSVLPGCMFKQHSEDSSLNASERVPLCTTPTTSVRR